MAGDGPFTTDQYRSEIDKKIIRDMKKDIEDTPSTLPSMDEMIKNAGEGFDFAERHRRLYGIQEYRVSGVEKGLTDLGRDREWERRFRHSLADDRELRDSLSSVSMKGDARLISEKEREKELEFRKKEECYKQKTSDQEKAAMERNEPVNEVSTEALKIEAENLRARLKTDIDMNNALAAGEREYYRQYLDVIDDLVKTRLSKGSLFGNYKKHIALAEEKYRFYSTERERIIGREQAKFLMKKPGYKEELEAKKKADPITETDLTNILTGDEISTAYNYVNAMTLAKAMKEYKECTAKVYELRMHIATLKAAGTREENALDIVDQSTVNKEQKTERRHVIPDRLDGEHYVEEKSMASEYMSAISDTASLDAYLGSMQAELNVWKFHADASLLCVRHLLDPSGAESAAVPAHAGYIKKHFGVDLGKTELPGSYEDEDWPDVMDPKTKLKDRGIRIRVGLESDISGMDAMVKGKPRGLIYRWNRSMETAKTGYQKQAAYETAKAENTAYRFFCELRGDRKMTYKEEEAYLERVTDITLLMRPIQIGASYDEKKERTTQKNLQEYISHMENMDTIRNREAADEDVKAAIKAELPFAEAAFADIDAFMNIGPSKEIFTEKKHEDIFSHTEGMPTFERKTRQLRDLISSMLRRSDILDQIGEEPQYTDLHKKLFQKWLFANRALSFVDYRRQLMERGYDSSLEDWAEDTCMTKDFWHEADHSRFEWGEDKTGYVPRHRVRPAGAAAAAAGDGVEQPEPEAPLSVLKKAQTDGARNLAGRKESAAGLTLSEKQFFRPEYYESAAFSTRKQQREAIMSDLWKAADLSSYDAACHAIRLEVSRLQDEIKMAPPEKQNALRERKTQLDRELDEMVRLIDERTAEISERADRLLETLKVPDTFEEKSEKTKAQSRELMNLMNIVQGIDRSLKADITAQMAVIQNASNEEELMDAIGGLEELHERLETPYRDGVQAYVDDCMDSMRKALPLMDKAYREYTEAHLMELEKRRKDTSPEGVNSFVAYLGVTNRELSKNTKYESPMTPQIITVMRMTENVMKSAENSPRKADRVSFESMAQEVRYLKEGEAEDEKSEADGLTSRDVLESEEEIRTQARVEARAKARSQRKRLSNAQLLIKAEETKYNKMLRAVSEDTIEKLPGFEELDDEQKEIVADMGCLVLPLEKTLSGVKAEEGDDGETAKLLTYCADIMIKLLNGNVRPEEKEMAVLDTVRLVNTGYKDIDDFLKSEKGSRILMARNNEDFTRLAMEGGQQENYSEDVAGIASLRKKAFQLDQLIGLGLDFESMLTPEAIEELNNKSRKLESLLGFLDAREELINAALSRLPESGYKPKEGEPSEKKILNDYAGHVMENPEYWRLDALKW